MTEAEADPDQGRILRLWAATVKDAAQALRFSDSSGTYPPTDAPRLADGFARRRAGLHLTQFYANLR